MTARTTTCVVANLTCYAIKLLGYCLQVDYMDSLVYGSPLYSTVRCPYRSCNRIVQNTARYVARTRPPVKTNGAVPNIANRTTAAGISLSAAVAGKKSTGLL